MLSFHLSKYAKIFFGLQDESIMAVILLPIHFIRVIKCVEKHWFDLLSIHTISSLCFFLSSNWMRNCSSSKAERYRVSWAFWNSMIWSNTARNWFNRDCKHTQRTTELQKWGQVWGITTSTQLPCVNASYPVVHIQQAARNDGVQENVMSCYNVIQILSLLDLIPQLITRALQHLERNKQYDK